MLRIVPFAAVAVVALAAAASANAASRVIGNASIFVYDVRSGKAEVVERHNGDQVVVPVAFTEATPTVLHLHDGQADIRTGTKVMRRWPVRVAIPRPNVSPDGRRAAWSTPRGVTEGPLDTTPTLLPGTSRNLAGHVFWTPDSTGVTHWAWDVPANENAIDTIDVATRAVRAHTVLHGPDGFDDPIQYVGWTGDGRLAISLVSNDTTRLSFLDPATGVETPGPVYASRTPRDWEWSPDGGHAARAEAGRLHILTRDTTGAITTTSLRANGYAGAPVEVFEWAVGGARLAVTRARKGSASAELGVVNLEASPPTLKWIARLPGYSELPVEGPAGFPVAWNIGGTRLAFAQYKPQGSELPKKGGQRVCHDDHEASNAEGNIAISSILVRPQARACGDIVRVARAYLAGRAAQAGWRCLPSFGYESTTVTCRQGRSAVLFELSFT
ncbi:MAG: hypothetical protein ACEQSX_10460 [Baekduiaceae bacterium]